MERLGEITQRLIAGPAEMVGEFEDAGNAAAAKANLDLFLKWCFSTHTGDRATPAVALIVNQSKLDPVEDRLRRSDWGKDLPEPKVEGASLLVDAPKSKRARDVIRRVMMNSKPRRIYDRPKKGGGGGLRVVILAVVGLLAVAGAGAAAWFFLLRPRP